VIKQYAGGGPISRNAGVIAPGAVVMAIITAVRGRPVKGEWEAAEGRALPILGSPTGNNH
jgi:hypothetical protein